MTYHLLHNSHEIIGATLEWKQPRRWRRAVLHTHELLLGDPGIAVEIDHMFLQIDVAWLKMSLRERRQIIKDLFHLEQTLRQTAEQLHVVYELDNRCISYLTQSRLLLFVADQIAFTLKFYRSTLKRTFFGSFLR